MPCCTQSIQPESPRRQRLDEQQAITVSYLAICLWCNKFGSKYVQILERKNQGYGDTFFIDRVFIKVRGKPHYLRRAVDQDG
jgi:putative transposase